MMEVEDVVPLGDEAEIDEQEEMSDEDAVLSNDSCIDSDMDDDDDDEDVEIKFRDLKQNELNTLDNLKKMCCNYFYFTEDDKKYCAECTVEMHGLFSRLRAVNEHEIQKFTFIDGLYCSNCRNPLHQIILRNICTTCTK